MKRPLLLASLALMSLPVLSQFRFQGVGIFGALTSSAHYYRNLDWENNNLDTNFRALYPQSNISKERLSWGAGQRRLVGLECLPHG